MLRSLKLTWRECRPGAGRASRGLRRFSRSFVGCKTAENFSDCSSRCSDAHEGSYFPQDLRLNPRPEREGGPYFGLRTTAGESDGAPNLAVISHDSRVVVMLSDGEHDRHGLVSQIVAPAADRRGGILTGPAGIGKSHTLRRALGRNFFPVLDSLQHGSSGAGH